MQTACFIGLGAMGTPMARQLLETGTRLAVFDVVEERREELGQAGARVATSPRDAAVGADVVVIMVADGAQADDVLWGPVGVVEALTSGTVVVVTSTVGPAWMRATAERLGSSGIALVDAPVSGGVARAGDGDLLIMVSGAVDDRARVAEHLSAMGSTVVTCGDEPGQAQSVKLVNQLLCGVHIAVAAEALGFAAALGLDPTHVFETIRHGAAASFMLDDRGARMVAAEFEPAKSALDIFVKDMGLVAQEAQHEKFPTPIASAAQQLFSIGSSMGLGRLDDSSLVQVFEQWAGTSVSTSDGSGPT